MIKLLKSKNLLLVALTVVMLLATVMGVSLLKTNTTPAEAASLSDCTWAATSQNIFETSGNSITISETDKQSQFYLASNNNFRDELEITATFQGEDSNIDGVLETGLVLNYVNSANYVYCALVWDSSISNNGLAHIRIDGILDSDDIHAHRNEGMSNVVGAYYIDMSNYKYLPDSSITLNVKKQVNTAYKCFEFVISIKAEDMSSFDVLDTVIVSNLNEEKGSCLTKLGVYGYKGAFTVSNINFKTEIYQTANNQTLGGWTVNNTTPYLWAYNEETGSLRANGRLGTTWKQSYAIQRTNMTGNYYSGVKFMPYYTDNLEVKDNGSSEYIAGMFPFYGNANNNVFVYLSRWNTSGTVNLTVAAWLNGGAPSTGEFNSKSTSLRLFGAVTYLECYISGNKVSVYLNRSKTPTYELEIAGLQSAMQSTTPYYGPAVNSCSAEYYEIQCSDTRIFTSEEDAQINLNSYTQVGKINQVCYVDAVASNSLREACKLSATCWDPDGNEVELTNGRFIATKLGNYYVDLLAYDSFDQLGDEMTLVIRIVSAETKLYNIVYKAQAAMGHMCIGTAVVGENYTLENNAYTHATEIFLGWATREGGNVVYENGATVKDLSTTDGATVTLYAVWSNSLTNDDAPSDSNGGGCGGSITASSIFALVALGGIALFIKKAIKN